MLRSESRYRKAVKFPLAFMLDTELHELHFTVIEIVLLLK